MSYNPEKFKKLVNRCIGTGSKTDFADRTGLSREHVSRMLSAKGSGIQPSRNTLKKISAAYPEAVSYEDLLAACGYEDAEAGERKELPMTEKAILNAQDLKEGLSAMTKGVRSYSSIQDLIETVEMLFSSESYRDIRFNKPEEYEGDERAGAEMFSIVRIMFEDRLERCYTWLVLYYSITKGGNIVVMDYAMDGKSLLEAGLKTGSKTFFAGKDPEELAKAEYVYITESNSKTAEKLLKMLFGDPESEIPYMSARLGFGFYIDSIPGEIRKFFADHKRTMKKDPELSEFYSLAEANDHAEDAFLDYADELTAESGYEAAVACIMRKETGYPFHLYRDENTDKPRSCIMIADVVDRDGEYTGGDLEELKKAVLRYAKALGVAEFGAVYVSVKESLQKKAYVYKVSEEI